MKPRRRPLGFLLLGFLIVLLTLSPGSARADVGIPPSQPGSSLSPGDYQTKVQMVSEQVEIVVEDTGYYAWVKADFQMFNTGTEDENIEVWFPFGETRPENKAFKVIQVSNFQAWVEGTESEVTIEKSDEWNYIWAHWPVLFPADTPLTIQVSYRLSLDHYRGPIYNGYTYFLETGAGWEGVIENALITVQAPYPLQELDDFLGGPAFLAQPEGYTVNGREVRWELNQIEPTEADNIGFYFFSPGMWNSIADSIQTLESNPTDGNAHYRLAVGLQWWISHQNHLATQGYGITPSDIIRLERLAADSYLNALEHSPPDEGIYISALYYFRWHASLLTPEEMQGHYYNAIQLFPENDQLQEIYQIVLDANLIAEGPPPSLTPTQPEETEVIITPERTPTPQETSNPTIFNPVFLVAGVIFLCGAALLIIIMLKRRKGMGLD